VQTGNGGFGGGVDFGCKGLFNVHGLLSLR
jgi:hypothetical protein